MSLLDPPTDPIEQRQDLEVSGAAPRSGTWYDPDDSLSDGRVLTQDQTDVLVRNEIMRRTAFHDLAEVGRVVGPARVIVLPSQEPYLKQFPRSHTAVCQRGGIDSDPLVRILARRIWGRRDRDWFELRGVHEGERVRLHMSSMCSRAWDDEHWAELRDADVERLAMNAASPGALVRVRRWRGIGMHSMLRVTGRLRDASSQQCDICTVCAGSGKHVTGFPDRSARLYHGKRCFNCYGCGFVNVHHDS